MNRADVQGIVFSGYRALPHSLVVLLDFSAGAPGGFLRRLLPGVTSGAERASALGRNIAFTASGLAALGVSPETLRGFSVEFREGMAERSRSVRLGDLGEDAPAGWEFGAAHDRIDAVLLVYAATSAELAEERVRLEQSCARFALGARVLETYLPADGKEHFGFRMGVSEPGLTRRDRRLGRERVPLGEFLLGHKNALGERTPFPSAPRRRSTRELGLKLGRDSIALGRNGSYLVIRKIEQRVDAFRQFAASAGGRASDAGRVAASLIGRWPNGAPLVLEGQEPRAGERHFERPFGYASDPLSARCPLGAHVRCANPRDQLGARASAHRLLRRGRLYGPPVDHGPSGEERGLLFMALNADLSRQFETIQASFLQGFGGFGARGEGDLLTARGRGARFVRVRGGVYTFLPSISALNYLADLVRP